MEQVQTAKRDKKRINAKKTGTSRRYAAPDKPDDWQLNSQYEYATMDKSTLKPGCDKIIDALERDLLKWAKTDDAISMDGFVTVTYLATPRVYEYAQKHEGLKNAISMAKHLIGQRREQRALEGKYNANIVIKTMPIYSPEYKAWVQEYQRGAVQGAGGGGTRYIVVDTMPNSDLVPARKHIEEEEDSDSE